MSIIRMVIFELVSLPFALLLVAAIIVAKSFEVSAFALQDSIERMRKLIHPKSSKFELVSK